MAPVLQFAAMLLNAASKIGTGMALISDLGLSGDFQQNLGTIFPAKGSPSAEKIQDLQEKLGQVEARLEESSTEVTSYPALKKVTPSMKSVDPPLSLFVVQLIEDKNYKHGLELTTVPDPKNSQVITPNPVLILGPARP